VGTIRLAPNVNANTQHSCEDFRYSNTCSSVDQQGCTIRIFKHVSLLVTEIQCSFHHSKFRAAVVAFLIGILGGGVQLGPLGTAATNRLIVPTPGDYDDGGRETGPPR
jgi:hypothetical protein